MNIFYLILYKLITGSDLDFSLNSPLLYIDSPLAIMSILQFYLHAVWLDKHGSLCDHITSKYKQLDLQMRNIFFIEPMKSFILEFGKSQKHYFALARLARLWKIKRAPIQIDSDLCGNILNIHSSNTVGIYQDGASYYFSISDLINIFSASLLHTSYYFISNPCVPKNPYTNVEFSKANMYKIYWIIKKSDYKMPVIIQFYYNTFFRIDKLVYRYEAVIRDLYIEYFIKTSHDSVLYGQIKQMLHEVRHSVYFSFHKDFPVNKMVEIMRPYIRLYLIYKYSLSNTDEKFHAYNVIKYKLKKLYDFNPLLGTRSISKPPGWGIPENHSVYINQFHTNYIPFHEIKLSSEYTLFDSDSDSESTLVDDDTADDVTVDDDTADDDTEDN